jgi:hypothetical protein
LARPVLDAASSITPSIDPVASCPEIDAIKKRKKRKKIDPRAIAHAVPVV